MPHLTYKLLAALLTFALGVIAASLWFLPGVRDRWPTSSRPATPTDKGARANEQRPGAGECEDWAEADVASQVFGWDLSYMSVLERVGFCPGNPVCGEWAKAGPPLHKYLAEWQEDPIISSIEFEVPDGHADMISIWLIRTKGNAYYRGFSLSQGSSDGIYPIPAQDYDSMFEALACMRQGEPYNPLVFGAEGFVGFLSLYKEGKSRQMLLTHRDLFEGDMDTKVGKPGRFSEALRPLASSLDRQHRQPAPVHK